MFFIERKHFILQLYDSCRRADFTEKTIEKLKQHLFHLFSDNLAGVLDFYTFLDKHNIPYSPNGKRNIRDPFKENIDSSRTVAMIQRGP